LTDLRNSHAYDHDSAGSAMYLTAAATESSHEGHPSKPRRIGRRVLIAVGAVVLVLLSLYGVFAPEIMHFAERPVFSAATDAGTIDLDRNAAPGVAPARYLWVNGTLAVNLTLTAKSPIGSYSEYFIPIVESRWTSRKPLRFFIFYVGRSLPRELGNKGSQRISCRVRRVHSDSPTESGMDEWRGEGLQIAHDYVLLDWIEPDEMPAGQL
jgi:hypothetical protein